MDKDYSVRQYCPSEKKEIVHLLQLVFDGWPHFDIRCTPLEHWKWKFEDNPLEPTIVSVGISDNKVVGCVHRIPRKIKIGDGVFLCSSGADVAVRPDFQKIGVFKKVDKLVKKLEMKSGMKFHYGISGNPIIIKHYSDYLHVFPHDIFVFVRIKDIDLHLQKAYVRNVIPHKYGFHLLMLFNKLRNTRSLAHMLSGPPDQDFRISEICSFDERINMFWDEIKDHYNFIVERSKEYMNWRYCDSRGGDYIIKIAERDGRILGYIVLRVNRYREDYPIGYIIDLLTLPDRLDVADALLRDAIHDFDNQSINVTRFQIVRNHPHEIVFRNHGFMNSRQKVHIVCMPLASLDEYLRKLQRTSAGRLHFAYGDYDDI